MKKVAVTGGTGFLGRYLLKELSKNYKLKCWARDGSDTSDLPENIEWLKGELLDKKATEELVKGVDYVVHAALYRIDGYSAKGSDILDFTNKNLRGSLMLIQEAFKAKIEKFIFISTCAVHDIILNDRALDETHPLWPKSHYGAYKAAVEKFVHSYGKGEGFNICALRPTGIYGLERNIKESKWYDLVNEIKKGKEVKGEGGGKEVHVKDVAKSVKVLLETNSDFIRGEAFNCYDMYISDYHVAELAKEISGAKGNILGTMTTPKNQIITQKLKSLGMEFGGEALLRETVKELLD
jgi:nucleoside-diphosphate-sugar epimerase